MAAYDWPSHTGASAKRGNDFGDGSTGQGAEEGIEWLTNFLKPRI